MMNSLDKKLQFELDKINLEVYALTILTEKAVAKGDYKTSAKYYLKKKKLLKTKKLLKALIEA